LEEGPEKSRLLGRNITDSVRFYPLDPKKKDAIKRTIRAKKSHGLSPLNKKKMVVRARIDVPEKREGKFEAEWPGPGMQRGKLT